MKPAKWNGKEYSVPSLIDNKDAVNGGQGVLINDYTCLTHIQGEHYQ